MGEYPDEYNRLERHLEKNHFELSDLENRRSYSLLALAQETKLVVQITGKFVKLSSSLHTLKMIKTLI